MSTTAELAAVRESEPFALRQVRDAAATMLSEGRDDEAFEFLLSALAAVLKKSRELELLLAKMRTAGRSSERTDSRQLALLFEELIEQLGPETETPDPDAELRSDAALDHEIKGLAKTREKPKREPSRSWRTQDSVERHVHEVAVPLEERPCRRCGRERRKIGEDVSRVLEYVPGHFREHEYRREKLACGRCKRGVTTARGPEKLTPKSAADVSVVAHVVVSKYCDHTPLHRLHGIFERSGVTIPVSTLADWTAEVADRVEPLVERIAERIIGDAYVVGTDATGLRVLDPKSPENIQRGTIWAYVGDDRDVVFRYTPTAEGASGPWKFLAGRQGYIQADAAGVFDRLYNGQVASALEVGCWAHARRKFVALQGTDSRVAYPLRLIRRLYRLEHLADLYEHKGEERAAFRQERSQPELDKLQRWLAGMLAQEPPSSEFAKAANYTLRHWTALTRFVEDGRLLLDNNGVERQLRAVALGRNNYLFAGSHDGARRAATLYSLMRTCALHGVEPLPYLTGVLRRLADGWGDDRLDELLPHRWQRSRASPETG